MSYGPMYVVHTVWTYEQWREHKNLLADVWDEYGLPERKALLADFVAHSGDLAYREAEAPIVYVSG